MSSARMRSRAKTRSLFMRCIHSSLSRPEQLTVSQWAAKYRTLDESSALPGKWQNDITPYLVEIMDCFNDPYIHFINFVKSTQVGGTEALINATGWIITKNPSPTMIVYPTDDLAKDTSNDRLKPVYERTPEIAERYFRTRSSEMNLRFRNMKLYLRSGGTPSKLASKPIKYLFFDEIDKMPGAQRGEAAPYKLALQRTGTFVYSREVFTVSTPTYRENYVWRLHERADEQREYHVPCPHCGEMITLKWQNIKFIANDDKKLTNKERAQTAMYYCQACGAEIPDKEKPGMLRRGEWRDVKRTCKGKAESVSYHINALYSFFVKWSDVAFEYLETRDDPEEFQNFVNSWLGEPWEDTKLKADEQLVMKRCAPEAAGVVPEWAELLTAGIDVQSDCVYYDIVAWGESLTSQSILHGQALTLKDTVKFMDAVYKTKSGRELMVDLCLVDSGDQTDMVYEFCSLHEWAIPSKGVASGNSHFRLSHINRPGRGYNGQPLMLVDGAKYKDLIATRLHYENGVGACMVHADCDLEYALQLTNEHKVTEGKGRNRKLVWRTKTVHANNHYLDCRVYASAAADCKGARSIGQTYDEPEQTDTTPKVREDWIY